MSNSCDGFAIIRQYMNRIVSANGKCPNGGSTMKVLLLDATTTQILSSVYSQTEILNQQVYLVTRLDEQQQQQHDDKTLSLSHLQAVVYCRPTPNNVELIGQELLQPRFANYHLFFSNMLSSGLLRLLAEKDVQEKVVQVQEVFADFLPLDAHLWTLQSRHSLAMTVAAGTSWAPKYATQYERNLQGLQSMLLALKKQPSCIRYASHSPCAEELAKDLYDAIQADDIFQFRKSKNFCVLVLDRRDDPVTPLLSQWTYQAMVHELLGLNNSRVLLRGAPNVPKDLEEVVLSATQDDFFGANRHANFGQLGEAIQKLLQDYQRQTAQHSVDNLNTIEEMQHFLEKFPEFQSQSHTVSKHVAIMGELARLVEVCSLMDVSQLEQELACHDDHHSHWRELLQKLQSPSIKIPDKLRLGLLYALRYEVSGNLHMVQSAMAKGGVPPDMVNLVNVLLRYGGTKSRGAGLYDVDLMAKMTKSIMTSVQGVQNVYSQHVPLIMDTIQSIVKGKLSTKTYPYVSNNNNNTTTTNHVASSNMIPDEILIFMVGGVTYEEGHKVHEFNAANNGRVRVVLGGSTVHNSTSFLEELKSTSL